MRLHRQLKTTSAFVQAMGRLVQLAHSYTELFQDGHIARGALLSRLAMLAAMVLADSALPDFDASATHLSDTPCLGGRQAEGEVEWPRAKELLDGLITWDAVHFTRIAECGYEHEQSHAFFPVFPLLLRAVRNCVLWPLLPKLGPRATLALAGFVVSNTSFVVAAVLLHRLSLRVLHSRRLAALSALLFCINPASVFYSAIYTESLYAATTFLAMLALEERSYLVYLAAGAVSAGVRSNGVLNAGYLAHHCLRRAAHALRSRHMGLVAFVMLWMLGGVAVIALPLLLFQWYGYQSFCAHVEPTRQPPWCHHRVPYLYGYVQKHYWGVGFLTYYQLKQIPNFALAMPILVWSVCGICCYCSVNWREMLLLGTSPHPPTSPRPDKKSIAQLYLSSRVMVYVFHWIVLTLVAVFVMHIQVATRFLSASPPLYWYAAHLWVQRRGRRLLVLHSTTFAILGAVMHTNFLPWT